MSNVVMIVIMIIDNSDGDDVDNVGDEGDSDDDDGERAYLIFVDHQLWYTALFGLKKYTKKLLSIKPNRR